MYSSYDQVLIASCLGSFYYRVYSIYCRFEVCQSLLPVHVLHTIYGAKKWWSCHWDKALFPFLTTYCTTWLRKLCISFSCAFQELTYCTVRIVVADFSVFDCTALGDVKFRQIEENAWSEHFVPNRALH